MEVNKFRKRLFYLLLGSKIAVVFSLFLFWIAQAYSTNQFKELLLLIAPLFVTNITIALKYWLQDQKEDKPALSAKPISGPIKTLSWWGTIGYGIYMIVLIIYYSTRTGDEESFRSLKELLGIGEILFGGYIGLIVSDIFKE